MSKATLYPTGESPTDILYHPDPVNLSTLTIGFPVDTVNRPSHYTSGNIECLDYIADVLSHEEYIGFLRGNIIKYQHRWRNKNGLEDLKKAQFYTNKLVELVGVKGT